MPDRRTPPRRGRATVELRRAVLADVAHELRAPLAVLQAATESMVAGTVEASGDNLAALHEEVLRLGRIVEDLETLSRADAAVLRIERRPVELAEITARALAALRPAFAAAGLELVTRLVPAPALADPDRARQVLANLLTNALKFTPPGGQVTVSVTPGPDAAILEVSDTGTGIPVDELPHVFERFWRGRQSGRIAGSGIGLAVVDSLVRAHRGTVEVRSDASTGTRFTVRLPRVAG